MIRLFGQFLMAFGRFMSLPLFFENPRTPMVPNASLSKSQLLASTKHGQVVSNSNLLVQDELFKLKFNSAKSITRD